MSRGQARRGIAASTAFARSRVVRSGRRATMNSTMRRAHRSSPYWRRMRSSSAGSCSLTTSAAVRPVVGSILMSSGPSARKLNPRSGSSTWVLERPKSKRIRSAGSKPFCLAMSPSSEKAPWTTTSAEPNAARDSRPAPTAEGSRSIPSSLPPGVILSRIWRAWPACPRVQSIATAPTLGWSSSITSCESAGTCELMSRDHPVSEFCEPSLCVGAVAVPSPLGPDFHPRAGADHHHRRRGLDPRQAALLREQADPSLAIGLERIGERIERPRQRAMVRTRQRAAQLFAERRPQVRRVDRQHAVLADRHEAALAQLLAEGCRDRHPPLVVHPHPMRSSKQRSSGLPELLPASLGAGAEAATAAVELEREAVSVLVEAMVDTGLVVAIAAAGRSGVEKVYGVPYLDVGCDVWFHVCRIHHFSPLITAIRRRQ